MASVDLPWDITTEILSRLPVKSLMRFKCVSMSFYNLISYDPFFRKKHIYHQSSFKKVILAPHNYKALGGRRDLPCPLLSLSPEGDVRDQDMNIYLELPDPEGGPIYREMSFENCSYSMSFILREIRFHNCCDGLFCMTTSGGDAVIWNPTTRQIRTFQSCLLPNLPNPRWNGYSLAHDSSSDVYKLLGLSIYGPNTYRLCFYSTETGMWRYIEESPPCDYVKYNGYPTIMNGAFHWVGSNEEHFRMPHVVVTLDISDETYGTLALPQAICDDLRDPMLYELKGKLCIFSLHTSEWRWDLWVMNEYGDPDSMVRMFRMSCGHVSDLCSRAFHMLEDDTLVVYKPKQIYSYKDGRILRNTKVTDQYWFEMHPYVYFESVISPHTFLQGNEQLNQKIIPNGFPAIKHSSDTVPENTLSSEIVANN